MTTRIETSTGHRWGTHTALVHLQKDYRQLSTDALGNADPRVLAADRAAVVQSRRQLAQASGTHLVDITI